MTRTPRQLVEDLLAASPATATSDEADALRRALDGQSRPSQGAVHRAIQNYLVNELKLGEARVVEIVREIVGEHLRRWLDGQMGQGSGGWLQRNLVLAVQDTVRGLAKMQLAAAKIKVTFE